MARNWNGVRIISTLALCLLTPAHLKGNSHGRPGTLVINEIMYHPQSNNDLDEYIELFNAGSETINLREYELTRGVSLIFPSIEIGPNAFLVVAADVSHFRALYPDVTAPVIGGWQGKLSNQGEVIRLRDANGDEIDQVEYVDEGIWAQRMLGPLDHGHRGWVWSDAHDGGGASLELVSPHVSNAHGQNWRASQALGGTPGQTNSVHVAETAPVIERVRHRPPVPTSSDWVEVTARLESDAAGVQGVSLYWRVDRSGTSIPAAEVDYDFQVLPMRIDDNGQYWAELAPQADGTIVEFYVRLTDQAGRSRSFPEPADVDGQLEQVTNLLYQVDDSFDAQGPWRKGDQPIYRVVMTQAEADRLALIGDADIEGDWWTSEAMSNAQMNGTFISIDDEGTKVRYNVGVRNRGNRSRFDPPMNYHIGFRNDRTWNGDSAINLNSKFTHCQVIAGAYFRLAGIEGQNIWAVQLRVNGQNPASTDPNRTFGTYAALQVFDSEWAREHAPEDPDGNLYRCTYDQRHGFRTVADLTFKGRDPNQYRENYYKKTNIIEDDWTDLFDLTYALSDANSPDDRFIMGVEQIVNVEQWTHFMAADTLLGNRERGLYSGLGDDYALYAGVKDRRFWLVPHDLDTVLGEGDEGYVPEQDILSYRDVPGLSRFMDHPDVRTLYYEQFRVLAETVYTPETMNALIDETLGDWVPAATIANMKQFVLDRRFHVLTGPNAQVPPE